MKTDRYVSRRGRGTVVFLLFLLLCMAGCGRRESAQKAVETVETAEEDFSQDADGLETDGEAAAAAGGIDPETAEAAASAAHTVGVTAQENGESGTAEEIVPAADVADEAEEILSDMSLEEKVCQLFVLTPEQLTGVSVVTAAGEMTEKSLRRYPVGGLIYFAGNLVSAEQTRDMLQGTQRYAVEIEGLPLLLCVDEEGGRVSRVGALGAAPVKPMAQMADEKEAYAAGSAVGETLAGLGFNLDFAPVADVLTNPDNTVIGDRSFGSDPARVAGLAEAFSDGLHAHGILSTYKHFPGHGATAGDTHAGYAYTDKTYQELCEAELVPFAAAQEAGADLVMAAHISVPSILPDGTPCSLSYRMITEILRGDLGYQGLVITDALNMGAVTAHYSSAQAAVLAVAAGSDLLLMPADFQAAYQGILDAVADGTLTEERIDESVLRILRVKLRLREAMAG